MLLPRNEAVLAALCELLAFSVAMLNDMQRERARRRWLHLCMEYDFHFDFWE